MLPQEIIIKKRSKQKLSKADIDEFVNDIITEQADDAQIAAFTMEVLLNKLSKEERVNLTMAMAHSGKVLSYKSLKLNKPIVDKHSTGGVGDKVSLMLAPIVACLGICDPMIAGRGLGHTGGTIDKLESIPGYNCYPTEAQFKKVLKKVGCGIMGATKDIAPADKKMYAIRDISGTVESMDLITASILSKKLAAGLEGLVMDVKFGNGAFMENKRKAKKLAKYIEFVGEGANLKIKAVLTDMNQVLGRNVGNSVEVIEALDFLKGDYDKRLYKVTESLALEMLILGGIFKSRKKAKEAIYKVVHNGEALSKFQEMVHAMGGPKKLSEKDLKVAKYKKDIYSDKVGRVKAIDTHAIGIALIELGGGRTDPEQKIDASVGFTNFCQIGDKIGKKLKPITTVYASKKSDINKIEEKIKKSIKI